ncbi:23S rRNA pseudouridine(955/2504/2580) synthase RluC [Blochmannia endosymbiont of Colobopsis nipponica]|uniref:23S rRNA pseudouridine(955/2504/2580) synthase RluC n=1 Tax=Blochmannia endosymbiont of Colobopsis nipponica TaxID=2681987 RepID=UPI00177D9D50|nr:23S rRNA pseudouridine(955/2504/2580) synthase RluC [Blochmannia endosymbiont of Colobopsis nipponica]QOI11044.1 23S rRNA pseudouridine(955/2504/2580) synthase RluC [Blochmannia endosymbiont of Colobopsis nipponica]
MKNCIKNVNIINISSERIGQRVDNFLRTYLKGVPNSKIYRIIRKGGIRINGKRIPVRYRLQKNDILRIPPVRQVVKKQKITTLCSSVYLKNINLIRNSIIYEDDYLMIINKPSGLAVHSGTKLNFGIIEGLRFLRPTANFLELVHRLDKDTSGLLLLAKKRSALLELHKQFHFKKIQKKYLVLVSGQWRSSIRVINVPLSRCILPVNGYRFVYVDQQSGKYAETRFLIKERFDLATLIIATPITGRTHQIRVHTQFVGHPIAFDKLYGNKIFNKRFESYGLNRLFLHSFLLKFTHPNNGKIVFVKAPLDVALQKCLYVLRGNQ